MSSSSSHSLFVAHVAVGHARPLLALALNLLSLHPRLHITFLAANQLSLKLISEKNRFNLGQEVLEWLHLVFFGEVQIASGAGLIRVLDLWDFVVETLQNFALSYTKLLNGEPLLDAYTNSLVPTFPIPIGRVVSDVLLVAAVLPVKLSIEASLGLPKAEDIKIVAFAPLSTSFVAAFAFNPPHAVFAPIYRASLKASRAPGNQLNDFEIYEKLGEQNTSMVHIIGGGDVYFYELQPSVARWRGPTGWLEIMNGLIDVLQGDVLEGMIFVWEGDLTPEVLPLSKGTFKNFWEVGPQLPEIEWNSKTSGGGEEFAVEEHKGELMGFLDRAAREVGEKSVLLISFGSLFAIPLLAHVAILLEALNELKIRFIITQGVLEESIVDVIKSKVATSEGRGHLATWIPQNAVLAHKAISFFLTHCGSNSVHEAILHEIPMIAWPGTVDQVTIAIELSLVHKVAFELLQIRTEFNIGRPTARGPTVLGTPEAIRGEMVDVFSRMSGSDGDEMRVRVKKMREVLVASREGGRSKKAMLALGLE